MSSIPRESNLSLVNMIWLHVNLVPPHTFWLNRDAAAFGMYGVGSVIVRRLRGDGGGLQKYVCQSTAGAEFILLELKQTFICLIFITLCDQSSNLFVGMGV